MHHAHPRLHAACTQAGSHLAVISVQVVKQWRRRWFTHKGDTLWWAHSPTEAPHSRTLRGPLLPLLPWLASTRAAAHRSRGPPALLGAALRARGGRALAAWMPKKGRSVACAAGALPQAWRPDRSLTVQAWLAVAARRDHLHR